MVLYSALVAAIALAGRREQAKAVARLIPDLAVMLARLAKDPELPLKRRLPLLATVAYLAFPFDLIPDFIPIAGQADDAVIVAFVLRYLVRGAGADQLRAAWPGPPEGLSIVLRLAGVSSVPDGPDPVGRAGYGSPPR